MMAAEDVVDGEDGVFCEECTMETWKKNFKTNWMYVRCEVDKFRKISLMIMDQFNLYDRVLHRINNAEMHSIIFDYFIRLREFAKEEYRFIESLQDDILRDQRILLNWNRNHPYQKVLNYGGERSS